MFDFLFLVLFFVIFLGVGKMCGWGARKHRDQRRELESRCCGPRASKRGDREVGRRADEDQLSNLEARVRRLDDRQRRRDQLIRPAMHRGPADREREPTPVRQKAPSRLQELQQKFVDGQLTLQEYERELDRLERLD